MFDPRHLLPSRSSLRVPNARLRRQRIPAAAEVLEERTLLAAADYDVDLNDSVDALTDGVTILRYLAGFRGDSLVSSGDQATRTDPVEVANYLDALQSQGRLDIDGDDSSAALTDGILVIRFMAGFSGEALTTGAVGVGATRTSSTEILNFINEDVGSEFLVQITGGTELGPVNENVTVNGTVTGIAAADVASLLVQVDLNDVVEVIPDANGGFTFSTQLPVDGTTDGNHQIRIRATSIDGEQTPLTTVSFEFDTQAPIATTSLDDVERTAVSSIEVSFNEPLPQSVFDPANFVLTRTTGDGAPAVVNIASATSADDGQTALLTLNDPLGNFNYDLTLLSAVTDIAGNRPATTRFEFQIEKPTRISETSPSAGEELVSLTRETVIRFDGQVDPATVTPDAFHVIANSERIPGTLRVSSTERFATFFYDEPLPASTEVRIVVDGDQIVGRDGLNLDADNDGEPGGLLQADFRTLPLSFIPGTQLFGYVYDSYHQDSEGNDIPIVGATIFLDANPDVNAVTDEDGFFELGLQDLNGDGNPDGLPAPDFFVHIDGSTAINAPNGTAYATLGKPFHSIPGQRVQLEMDGGPDVDPDTPGEQFHIYLPPMAMDDIVDLNPDEDTEVGFGPAAQEQIRAMFADDPDTAQMVIDTMQVTYPAGSAQDENGTPATQATIIPVDPERLPAPLPEGAEPELVVSIQAGTELGFNLAGGSTNFDTPAPVTFPNLEGLAPAEQVFLNSFDHDAGEWTVVGTATVSEDGSSIVSDSDSGIIAPGWHYIDRFVRVLFNPRCLAAGSHDDFNQLFAAALSSLAFGIQTVDVVPFASLPVPLVGTAVDYALGPLSSALNAAAGAVSGSPPSNFTLASLFISIEQQALNPIAQDAADIANWGLGLADWINTINSARQNLSNVYNATLDCLRGAPNPIDGLVDRARSLMDQAQEGIEALTDGIEKLNDGARRVRDFIEDLTQLPPDLDASSDALSRATGIVELMETGVADISSRTQLSTVHQAIVANKSPLQDASGVISEAQSLANSLLAASEGAYLQISGSGGTVFAGRLSSSGSLVVSLRERSSFTVSMFDPVSRLTNTSQFSTGRGGTRMTVPFMVSQVESISSDVDQDGLGPIAETAIGTSPTLADTDGDGVSDLAEIEQGTDPLGGLAFPTGIIATLDLLVQTKAVDVSGSAGDADTRIAVAATGTNGIAVVDASQFDQPIILGQLDLNGDSQDVAVDAISSTAVVAAAEGGLHFVDISDPMMPVRTRTASGNVTAVDIIDGVAYAAVGARIISYDVVSGELLVPTNIADGAAITDLAHDRDVMYSMDANGMLRAFRVQGFNLTEIGSVDVPQAAGKLFVSGGVAYAAAINSYERGGFSTVDISNPASMSVISGADIVSPFVGPGTSVVANGSGLGLLVGSAGGQHMVDLVNLSDAENTNDFITRFDLASAPSGVAIASGIGYIAGGASGLHVVNYVGFDNQGIAPTVTIAGPGGTEIQEGSFAPIRVDVTDDVQVRDVELLMDGVVVARDVSAPFDLRAVTPALDSGATEVSFQVRATDTGGNAGLSEIVSYTLTPDITPPALINSTPADTSAGFRVQAVTLRFDEPIDSAALALTGFTLTDLGGNFQLGGGDDADIPLDRVEVLSPRRVVVYTTEPLGEGRYQLDVAPTIVADVAGNALTDPISINFTSFDLDEQNAVAWISDEDGDWNNAGNWSTGEVPGPNDAVILDRKTADPTITLPAGNVIVKSVVSREALILSGGTFTVTESSEVSGQFEVSGSGTLRADGSNTVFVASGPASVDGGSIFAIRGAQIHLPGMTSVSGSVDDVWEADGVGSILRFPNLTTITNGDGRDFDMTIRATTGGRIELPAVTTIVDPNTGDTRDRGVFVSADGPGSTVDLSALQQFTDANDNQRSGLTVSNSGSILADNLVDLNSVAISLDGSGTMPTSQITEFTNSSVTVDSVDANLTGIVDFRNSVATLNSGGTADLSNAAQVDGSSFFVNDGVLLELPGVTSVSGSIDDVWQADGVGSILRFPNLTTITNGDGRDFDMTIRATTGGRIELPAVTTIVDPNTGDTRDRGVFVSADGPGSTVDLSALQQFTDANDNQRSGLTVSNSGSILADNLVDLNSVAISLDGSGTMPTSQITEFTNSSVTVDSVDANLTGIVDFRNSVATLNSGGTADLSNAAQVDGSSFFVNDGVLLELPGVTSVSGSIDDVWQADGVGSILRFPNLTTITNGDGRDFDMTIRATTGGRIELPAVTTIVDPNTGDTRDRGVFVSADGPGSTVDLSALQQFTDANDNQRSGLTVSNSGSILADNLVDLNSVAISLDGSGTMPTSQITEFTNSSVTVDSVDANLTGIVDFRNSVATLNSGGTADLSNAAQVDGSSFFVNDGVLLELPGVTSVSGSIDDTWQADGVGSILRFPNLTTITNGDGRDFDMTIRATTGGRIELPAVTTIVDPNTGDTRDRGVFVSADGPGSTVDLSALQQFTDANDNQRSGLTVSNSGSILADNLVDLNSVAISLDGSGTMPTSQITEFTNSSVTVDSVDANLTGIVDFRNSVATLNSGGTADLSNAAQVDGSTFFVNDGVLLELPGVTSVSGSIDDTWQADGVGSILRFPNLTTITNGDGRDFDMTIRATTGGRIELPAVTTIVDPNTGDTRDRGVFVSADGPGSTVDLSALQLFSDANNNQESSLSASNLGVITLHPTQTSLQNITTSETSGGMIIGSFALRLAGGDGSASSSGGEGLDTQELNLVVTATIQFLQSAAMNDAQRAALQNVNFGVIDLPQNLLGYASAETIWIDTNAAGAGWFIDTTPLESEEFSVLGDALAGTDAEGRVDLVTVILHEIGHVFGMEHDHHDDGGIMEDTLAIGVRKELDAEWIDELFTHIDKGLGGF